MADEETPAERERKLRAEYWSKRLDQTLTHTHTATKLIYTVEGAVVALGAYTLQTLGFSRPSIAFAAIPVVLLVVLNLLHARFLTIQHSWYVNIDAELMQLLGVTPVVHRERRDWLASTHRIHRCMHMVIAGFLAIASVFMVLYGWCHWFKDLPGTATREPPVASTPIASSRSVAPPTR